MNRRRIARIFKAWLPAVLTAGFLFAACGMAAVLPRGCFVGGVDVSRLTRPAAAQKVRAALQADLRGRTFTVRVGEAAYVFRPPELYWETDLTAVLSALRGGGDHPLRRTLRLADEDRVLRRICADIYRKSANARILFDKDAEQPFTVLPESAGRVLDGAALRSAVRAALDEGRAEVTLEAREVAPWLTCAQAQAGIRSLSTFTTSFNAEAADRAHNIALAASKINGTVLRDGQTFSFNAAAGARTKTNGYRDAPIIFEGEFVAGTGGGVCQVSTTVYNAALLAGLTVTEYHPHSLAVGYVEPSFDAMVSGSSCDLKFRNDTGGAVYILCRMQGNRLTVRMYGKKGGVTYARESVVTGTIPPPDAEIREGEREATIRAPRDGIESVGYIVCRETGKRDRRILLRKDRYAPVRAIYCVPKNLPQNIANSEIV